MDEVFVKIRDANISVLKTEIRSDRKSIVCLHGIGESLICYSEAFRELYGYNIITLDNAGYGKSEPAFSGRHSTEAQADRIIEVLDALGVLNFGLIGHSWGGDIGTIMCKKDAGRRVELYINIESDIHRDNIIMSTDVSEAFSNLDREHFDIWLKSSRLPDNFHEQYKESFPQSIMKWDIASRPAGLRYLASMRMCDSTVYGETATEIAQQHARAREDGVIEWGEIYATLKIPTIYCWGTKSIREDSNLINFLKFNKIPNHCFQDASHWLMMDNCKEFYGFVRDFIAPL